MTTALQIITRALEHLNVKDASQELSADDSDLALRALISMLDAWQLDPQATIGLQELTYTPTAGAQSFTIGPAGNIVATMPVRIEMSSFYRVNGIDTPIGIANSLEEYTVRAAKSVQGLTNFIRYERSNSGTGTVYLYPASDGSEQLHLFARQDVVSGYASLVLGTNMTLPNGYRNALEWCLASEIAVDFPTPTVTQAVVDRKAGISLRRMKRANFVSAQIQPVVGTVTNGTYSINTL